MSHWDRKELLRLVDESTAQLQSPSLSVAQRQGLHELLQHYGNRAKSIHATAQDVTGFHSALTRILLPSDPSQG